MGPSESAPDVMRFIRVALLGINATVLFDVLKRGGHQTTITAQIAEFERTVDQVLFRK